MSHPEETKGKASWWDRVVALGVEKYGEMAMCAVRQQSTKVVPARCTVVMVDQGGADEVAWRH